MLAHPRRQAWRFRQCNRCKPWSAGCCRSLAALFAATLIGGCRGAGAAGGQQYARIKNPVPVQTGKKIEVIEFFSYGCPHCADLEPVMQGWMKTMPPDVAVSSACR